LEKQRKGFLAAFAKRNLKNLQCTMASQFEVAIFLGPHFLFYPNVLIFDVNHLSDFVQNVSHMVKHTLTSNEKIRF